MLKNNKGYLLTETIIAITVVATIITVVYTTSLGNYKMQDIELTKANTAQDLYTAKELRKFLYKKESEYIDELENNGVGYIKLFSRSNEKELPQEEFNLILNLSDVLDIKYIYVLRYSDLGNLLNENLMNSQIKNSLSNKIENDENENSCDYRYLVIYNNNSYSTIGIHCLNAGEV